MLPMILTLALRSFSFSTAEARRSFFSFSRAAGACQHLRVAIMGWSLTFLLQEIGDILLGLHGG